MLTIKDPYESFDKDGDTTTLVIADLHEFVGKFESGEEFSDIEKSSFVHTCKGHRVIEPNEDGYHASRDSMWIKMSYLTVDDVTYGIVYEENKVSGDCDEDYNFLTNIEKIEPEIEEVKAHKITMSVGGYASTNYHEF